jgi:hypothetical protein
MLLTAHGRDGEHGEGVTGVVKVIMLLTYGMFLPPN